MKILFSIITPVYNREDCIERCVESVMSQAFREFEMIVVSDGSTDGTLGKLESLAQRNSRLSVISYAQNKGVNFARNRGIEKAIGDYILFLDSDDTLAPFALCQIEREIIKSPDFEHYLFGVDDRQNSMEMPNESRIFYYEDWVSGSVSGDFAHVIRSGCLKEMMFVEEFRLYESLNWFRVLRKNRKQFYVPIVMLNRERNRKDSLTRESRLDSRRGIQDGYNFQCRFFDWYAGDYIRFGLDRLLKAMIWKCLFLGVALKEIDRNKALLRYGTMNGWEVLFFRFINRRVFGPLFFLLIRIKSKMSQNR